MSDEAALLILDEVDLLAGGRRLVQGLTWRLAPGQSWLVTGPSGCGKTLLAQALRGAVRPARGTIHYVNPSSGLRTPFPDESTLPRRAIVYAGTDQQRQALGPEGFYQARWNSLSDAASLTVAEALEPGALFAVSPFQILGPSDVPPDFLARRQEAVEELRVGPLLRQTVAQLSSGERRRLLLAHALRLEAGRVVATGPLAHGRTVRDASEAAR